MGCVQCNHIIKPPCLNVPMVIIKDSQSTIDKTIINTKQVKTEISNESFVAPIDPMLKEINLARTNSKEYSNKVNAILEKVQCINGKHLLVYNDEIKIELVRGKEHFISCINYLKDICQKMNPLIFADELKIPFPEERNDLILCRHYLSKEIEKKNRETKGKYTIIDFQYDICPNPILSTIIQIVDDSSASLQRRNNILNKSAKYVGITSGSLRKDIYCFYLLFAC